MSDPNGNGANLGEILRTSRRIEEKVDKLDDKLDGHAQTLAEHGIRLLQLEKSAQRSWERFTLWTGVVVALLVAVLEAVMHK